MKEVGPYRIRAVSELTGVPEATLRAWERRYAFPTPARTSSGYRLYSQNDVELVKRMRVLTEQGMAPVDAARAIAVAQPAQASEQDTPGAFARIAQRIVEATRRMDPASLRAEVRLAMSLADAHTIVSQIFRPALAEIGDDWARGEISVGHEHLVSDIITVATRDMLRLIGPAKPIGDVLLACFADEDHVMPLYAAAFSFAEAGYRPQVLGARTPPSALGAVIAQLSPALIGLSVTIAPSEPRAQELVTAYAQAIGKRAWIVGGAAAAGLAPLVEAHGGTVLREGDALPTVTTTARPKR